MISPCCALFPSLIESNDPSPQGEAAAAAAAACPGQRGGLVSWPGPEPDDLDVGGCVLSATMPREDMVVVRAIGEIDLASGPALERAASAALRVLAHSTGTSARTDVREAGVPRLVCDLSTVTFFAASGLSALVEIIGHTEIAGIDLRVIGTPRCVRLPLDATGVGRRLRRHDTLTEATSRPTDRDVSGRVGRADPGGGEPSDTSGHGADRRCA